MKRLAYILLIVSVFQVVSCKRSKSTPPPASTEVQHNFPDDIKAILVDKCATSGCHNQASYKGAGNLLLDSWEHLFDGSSNGAVVVPYSPDNSSLMYFVNTDPNLGTTTEPTMPYNGTPLSKEEYLKLRDWIVNGAPNKDGMVPFSGNDALRQKIYMVQQGCDLVAVIDAEKQVVMRYIKVGKTYATEQPNNIVMSPDGQYAYVSFWNANLIQKIDTKTDKVVAEVETPRAFQKAIQIDESGLKLIVCNWYTHDMIWIDATTMSIVKTFSNGIRNVSGFASSATSGSFYITSQFGNTFYKMLLDGSFTTHTIDGNASTTISAQGTPDPSGILFSRDNRKYFITCTNTAEVAVMDAKDDKRITTISVGENPQEMVLSKKQPYLFVSCTNDTASKLEVGSVYVINYNTHEVVKKIRGKFFQPKGIALDDEKGLLFIFSRNDDKNGPPPHHSSPCDGRNGFYNVYDINTLEPYTSTRFEVTVDPYDAVSRF
ncbi:MAG: hypothetical protein H6551_01805 [Chitinophagales bacterium]|nr:hypothetical protein [Chitinophagales bacterium]